MAGHTPGERYAQFSEDPRWVLFESRGGQMRVGDFIRYVAGDRIKILTNPGTVIPTTTIKEDKKISPQELCERHNKLLWEVRELREEQ